MKKLLTVIITALMLLTIVGCQKHENKPYEPDTPAPDPHTGVFSCEYGSMEFNGDGKTVICDFNKEFAELTGLPQGKTEGNYVFLSGNLPPHGSVDVRYDVAHELKLTLNGTSIVVELGIASSDGKTATVGVGMVTEKRIPVLLRIDGKNVTAMFEK